MNLKFTDIKDIDKEEFPNVFFDSDNLRMMAASCNTKDEKHVGDCVASLVREIDEDNLQVTMVKLSWEEAQGHWEALQEAVSNGSLKGYGEDNEDTLFIYRLFSMAPDEWEPILIKEFADNIIHVKPVSSAKLYENIFGNESKDEIETLEIKKEKNNEESK